MPITHIFTEDGEVTLGNHTGRFSQLVIGKRGAADFGGGTLVILIRTLDGGWHELRSFTPVEYSELIDKSVRLELPDSATVGMEMVGATSPNLYIEHRNQQDR